MAVVPTAVPESMEPVREATWFQNANEQTVEFFANGVEKLATWFVATSDWGMDQLNIEY